MKYENYSERVMGMVTQCYQDICDMLKEIVGVDGVLELSELHEMVCRFRDPYGMGDVSGKMINKVRLVDENTFEYQLENSDDDDDWHDDWFDTFPCDIFDMYDTIYNKLQEKEKAN